MRKITKISILSFCILFLIGGMTSCDRQKRLSMRGRMVMEAIVEANPRIAESVNVETSVPHEGITLVESDLKMVDSSANHIFIVEVDLTKGVTLRASTPNDQAYDVFNSLQTMPKQAQVVEEKGEKVLLGINADVFGRYGDFNYFTPRGVVYVDGENRSTGRGGENVFYIRKDGSAHLDRYEEFELVESEVVQAVGAWQALVWDGLAHTAEDYEERNLSVINPRTFIGVSEGGKTVWLIVVDGRQKGYSEGFLMEDMVKVGQALQCERACNLDGGGSTTLVVRNETEQGTKFVLKNSPSDVINGKNVARMVVNGLLVVEK